MLQIRLASVTAALIVSTFFVSTGSAQAPPPTATTKVTDNVYIFRYVGHQSIFIVTPAA